MAKTYNRQVALDTETTGMEIEAGNRLISIGCVEIVGRSITKRTFYKLINPEREVEEGAAKVHGYTWDKLRVSRFLSTSWTISLLSSKAVS